MTNTRLAEQCLQAAVEFLSKQPWNRKDADHPFVVDAEGDPTEMIAVVPGRHAKERGLLLLRGLGALRAMDELRFVPIERPKVEEGQVLLSVTCRETGGDAVTRVRRDPQEDELRLGEPVFEAREPGRDARPADEAELRLMLHLLKGFVRQGNHQSMRERWRMGDHEEPRLRLLVRAKRMVAEVDRVRIWPDDEVPELGSFDDAARLNKLDRHYDLGMSRGPYHCDQLMLTVVDQDSGEPLGWFSLGDRPEENAAAALLLLFAGLRYAERGCPRALRFRELSLFHALRHDLNRIGIRCEQQLRLPGVEEGRKVLIRKIRGDDHDPVLAEWYAAKDEITRRIDVACTARSMDADAARERYFGGPRLLQVPPRNAWQRSLWNTFSEWHFHRHRQRGEDPTLAEEMLAQPMEPRARELLRARWLAVPSMYVVLGVEPGVSTDLLDFLTGEELLVQDEDLSIHVEPGMGVVLRVYPGAPFHFASLAGPAIPRERVDAALEFLGEQLDFSQPIALEDEHLLGRLWGWVEKHPPDPRNGHLRNGNGRLLKGPVSREELLQGGVPGVGPDGRESAQRGSGGGGQGAWFEQGSASNLVIGRFDEAGDGPRSLREPDEPTPPSDDEQSGERPASA